MTPHFLIPDERLQTLSATRQGRISIAGFNYQASYAIARLASIYAHQRVLDLADIPVVLRYDWAEDLDEIDTLGRTILTQCKRVDDIGEPARLADVLLGFSPKWLWTAPDRRGDLCFRLVCSDPRFRAPGPIQLRDAGIKGELVRTSLRTSLERPAVGRSDRAVWAREIPSVDYSVLVEALWRQTEVVYLAAATITDAPAGIPMLPAERSALDILVTWRCIEARRQADALLTLRGVLHGNLAMFEPDSSARVLTVARAPRVITRADLTAALFAFRERDGAPPAFAVIGRRYLEEQLAKPKRLFIARPPEWADVVHGSDAAVRFFERDVTPALVARIRDHILESLSRDTDPRLHALFVVGAPGAGKSTLVRRVATILVEEGAITVADFGVNVDSVRGEEIEPIIADLIHLSNGDRPVIVLLDDAFFAASGWDTFLHRLSRSRARVGVFGASPDFLFERFGFTIDQKQIATEVFTLPVPSAGERQAIAHLYGRDTDSFSPTADDLLVLTMEAAAGESFGDILRRMWQTLNDGRAIDPFAHPDTLPWPVRAYIVVCYWHRGDERCPEGLLREALTRGQQADSDGYDYQLRHLRMREGWQIFSVQEAGRHLRRITGRTIGAAHPRIAREAWRLRPAAAFDPADWIVPASVRARLPYDAANLVVALVKSGDAGPALADRVVAEWGAAPGTRTTDLAVLSAALSMGGLRDVAQHLVPTLRERLDTPNRESWVAALQLWFLSAFDGWARSFPAGVRLAAHIECADFSVASSRMPQLARALGRQSPHHAAIVCRLLAALDGKLAWQLDSFLLPWLLAHAPFDALTPERLGLLRRWLADHSEDVSVRASLLSTLSEGVVARSESLHTVLVELVQEAASVLRRGQGDRRWEGIAMCLPKAVDALQSTDAMSPALRNECDRAVVAWCESVGVARVSPKRAPSPTSGLHISEPQGLGRFGSALREALGERIDSEEPK